MWLAISAIVLATAIGCNVLALWLIDWFGRNHPEITFRPEQNAKLAPNLDWASPILSCVEAAEAET